MGFFPLRCPNGCIIRAGGNANNRSTCGFYIYLDNSWGSGVIDFGARIFASAFILSVMHLSAFRRSRFVGARRASSDSANVRDGKKRRAMRSFGISCGIYERIYLTTVRILPP